MINKKIREAIYLLQGQGMSLQKISRALNVSKNTVISIIKQKGGIMNKVRKDKIKIDPVLLEFLYADCEGKIQRIYEKIKEEHGINVSYLLRLTLFKPPTHIICT